MAAAELKAKKEAKMVHRDKGEDTGRKRSIPCGHCGGTMLWSKVQGRMRYACTSCSLLCNA